MTYPKPGEIVLTDPTTGEIIAMEFDHVQAHEHYVTVEDHEPGPGSTVKRRQKKPWHRVISVNHEFTDSDDGGREYLDPTEEDDE